MFEQLLNQKFWENPQVLKWLKVEAKMFTDQNWDLRLNELIAFVILAVLENKPKFITTSQLPTPPHQKSKI